MLLFDGEAQPLTYLVPVPGEAGAVFQAPLQGGSTGVPSRACVVHVHGFDFSPYRTGLSLPTSTKEATRPKFFPRQRIHYYRFSDISSNYHVRITPSVNRQQCYYTMHCTGENGWVLWLVWRLRWLPSISFLFLRQLVKIRPGVGVRRVDMLL